MSGSSFFVQGTITLPPGFQLPPGAMIVKNEQGQFMVVNAGASASTVQSSVAATTLQHKPLTTHIVRVSCKQLDY